ncbi:hypothetical protein RND81_14G164600 [Saponaria officinalis]|uniref:Glutathione S-transferase n=1 Tax=Saponaria officinalis TaxID=3572 RepID=A0AAW1GMP3_SAPOF
MEDEKKVQLLGLWASPFVRMVQIALKLKGIPYEYIEESLKKKSKLLLQHNPIYKKVPVLVHAGKPICESLIILEYIDDTWKNSPQILPKDPYMRSNVRLWANFILNQVYESHIKVIVSQGIEEEKAIIKLKKNLTILEEHMRDIFGNAQPSIDEEMGMLDIILSTLSSEFKGIEEAFNLKNILDPQTYPLICSRMTFLCQFSVVQDTCPSHDKLIKFFRAYKNLYV